MNWPSIVFEYGPFPRLRLDYELFGFEFGRFGRISADGQAFTLPPEYIHIDQVCLVFILLHEPVQLNLAPTCDYWYAYAAEVSNKMVGPDRNQ